MAQLELDVPAEVLVPWLRQEIAAGVVDLEVRATREFRPAEPLAAAGEDAEAPATVTVVGSLEFEPPAQDDGWVLQVQVEDTLGGARLADDAAAVDGPEELDLETFEQAFLAGDGPMATAAVRLDDAAAEARFHRFYRGLLARHHGEAG